MNTLSFVENIMPTVSFRHIDGGKANDFKSPSKYMMAYTPRPQFLLTLFRELFNTIISSAGDDPLLARAHQIFQKDHTQTNNILLLAPIAVGIILKLLVSYYQRIPVIRND